MTNGKIVDTSLWVDFFNGVIDERTDATEKLIDQNGALILPVIIQEVLQGIRSQKLFILVKDVFLHNRSWPMIRWKWQCPPRYYTGACKPGKLRFVSPMIV